MTPSTSTVEGPGRVEARNRVSEFPPALRQETRQPAPVCYESRTPVPPPKTPPPPQSAQTRATPAGLRNTTRSNRNPTPTGSAGRIFNFAIVSLPGWECRRWVRGWERCFWHPPVIRSWTAGWNVGLVFWWGSFPAPARGNQNPHLGFGGWPVYVLRDIGGFLGASGVVCGRSIHCFHTAAGLPPAGWGSL